MKRALRLLVPALLIGLGVWLWVYLHPTPQEAIRRQLTRLANAATFDAREGLVQRALAAQDVAGFFAAEVAMNMEPRGYFPEQVTRAEIAEQVFLLRTQREIRSIKVKILDPVITLGVDNQRAIVELTVHAETEGEKHLLVQEMKVLMRLVEDDWLITRLETVRTLNRAPAPRRAHPGTAPAFSLSSSKGGEGRGEEAQLFPAEPRTLSGQIPSPQPSPRSGGERELGAVPRCASPRPREWFPAT